MMVLESRIAGFEQLRLSMLYARFTMDHKKEPDFWLEQAALVFRLKANRRAVSK